MGEIGVRVTQDLLKICLRFTSELSKNCFKMRELPDHCLAKIYLRFAWDSSKIWVRFWWDLSKFCQRFGCYMPELFANEIKWCRVTAMVRIVEFEQTWLINCLLERLSPLQTQHHSVRFCSLNLYDYLFILSVMCFRNLRWWDNKLLVPIG